MRKVQAKKPVARAKKSTTALGKTRKVGARKASGKTVTAKKAATRKAAPKRRTRVTNAVATA